MPERTLVAYYSMTGCTRRLADEAARALDATVEEIRETRPRRGPLRYFTALLDALRRRATPIEPPRNNPAVFDLLVVAGPVWAGGAAPAVRSYIREHGTQAARVAFVLTLGGRGAETAFAEMERLCGRPPVATLAVDAQHIKPSQHADALARFVAAARAAPRA